MELNLLYLPLQLNKFISNELKKTTLWLSKYGIYIWGPRIIVDFPVLKVFLSKIFWEWSEIKSLHSTFVPFPGIFMKYVFIHFLWHDFFPFSFFNTSEYSFFMRPSYLHQDHCNQWIIEKNPVPDRWQDTHCVKYHKTGSVLRPKHLPSPYMFC